MDDLDIINHMGVMHYGIPGWPGNGWRVSHEEAARRTHEQDHQNDEGIRHRHRHEREFDQEVLL